MIRPIVRYGHPVLRQRCREVTEVDDSLRTLAEDMLETMADADGVGLAAPQVGIDLRLAVIDVSSDRDPDATLKVNGEETDIRSVMPLVFINPELHPGKRKETASEGCLSIPGFHAPVRRPGDVRAILTMLDGTKVEIEANGLLARALQHETDHLNGVLFIDRLSAVEKVSARSRLRRMLEGDE